nr:MAG TPA: hypothetical protein [Bacteriophage sp.]
MPRDPRGACIRVGVLTPGGGGRNIARIQPAASG